MRLLEHFLQSGESVIEKASEHFTFLCCCSGLKLFHFLFGMSVSTYKYKYINTITAFLTAGFRPCLPERTWDSQDLPEDQQPSTGHMEKSLESFEWTESPLPPPPNNQFDKNMEALKFYDAIKCKINFCFIFVGLTVKKAMTSFLRTDF